MTIHPYQNASLPVHDRVNDLLPRLSLEEKAGLMFHMMIPPIPLDDHDTKFGLRPTREHLNNHLSHFNIMGSFKTAREFAEFINNIQQEAKSTRWGIPITISTDPRHAFSDNPQTAMMAGCFSQWPEHIGMAAIADPARMEEYADIVRQEYVAVGIRAALHPQADLATEYRWSRINGGLGEDAQLASDLVAAHVRGLQGETLGPESISACVKHFPGGGPSKNGYDPHFAWGKEQVYPGGMDMFEYHMKPFRAAIAAGVRVVMPSYGQPMGLKEFDEVAMAFNKKIITGILREELNFDGVTLSDWAIIKDMDKPELVGDLATARAWGVEHLTPEERVVRALEAGVDQFGGEFDPSLIINVVRDGRVPESRIDASVYRLLKDKFELGLFEHRSVNVELAEAIVGREDFVKAGLLAQKDAATLIKNVSKAGSPTLPLPKGTKIYLDGFKRTPTSLAVEDIAESPADADVAVVRLSAPWESVGEGQFARSFHHGSLEFPQETLDRVAELSKTVPVVLELYADRPAVLGSLNDSASAIILTFGLNENALVDILFGYSPKGKLPFELPRSNKAVEESKNDTPFDTKDPLYRFGHGLRYE